MRTIAHDQGTIALVFANELDVDEMRFVDGVETVSLEQIYKDTNVIGADNATPVRQVDLRVFLQGKLLLQKAFPSAQARYQLDIRSLPAGVYILRSFSQEGKILIEQVIKQ